MTNSHFAYNGRDVTEYVCGFIEAMLFSDASCYGSRDFFKPDAQEEVKEGRADGSLPADAGLDDIDASSMAAIVKFCGEFLCNNQALLEEALTRTDETAIGRDLYYTRARHGVGFDDREELEAIADRLTKAAGRGEVSTTAYEDENAPSGFYVEVYLA